LSSSRLARVPAVRFALALLCMVLVKPPSLNPQTSPQGKSVAAQTALIPFDLYDFDAKCPKDAAAGHCDPAVQDGGGVKVGDMVQGPQGDDSFYGATPGGGKHGWGTIFKITTTKGASEATSGAKVQVLYSFGDAGLTDGRNPSGGLTLGSDGNLYGVTYAGGVKNVGTIFRMARSASTPQILYSFRNGVPDPPAKGQPPPPPLTPQQIDDLSPSYPISPPILGSDGNLYGVTPSSNPAGGASYQLSSAGVLKCLHRFKGGQEAAAYGLYPRTLNQGSNGVFYGTTMQGGLGAGTVFQFNTASAAATGGGITTIYKFAANGTDGTIANGVLQGADGNLYGTTYSGGPGVRGVVFRLTPAGRYKVLHAFGGNQANPVTGVVDLLQNDPVPSGSSAAPGRRYYLYGTSALSGFTGLLFRLREDGDGTDFTVVDNFNVTNGAGPNMTPVLSRADSNLYGITAMGGKFNAGVFYELNLNSVAGCAPSVSGALTPAAAGSSAPLQFTGGTPVYKDSLVELATCVTAYRGTPTSATNNHKCGITILVHDSNAKFVQFLYREVIQKVDQKTVQLWSAQATYVIGDLVTYFSDVYVSKVDQNTRNTPNAASKYWTRVGLSPAGTLLEGPANTVVPPWNAGKTYASGSITKYFNDFYRSTVDNNVRNTPNTASKYWVPVASDPSTGCPKGVIHLCYPYTTDDSKPNWIPDAEPPNPYYADWDTQRDCDKVTLFDSPNFPPPSEVPGGLQRFVGRTFVVLNSRVVAEVRWVLDQPPPGFGKLNYHDVTVTRVDLTTLPGPFPELLSAKGFPPVP